MDKTHHLTLHITRRGSKAAVLATSSDKRAYAFDLPISPDEPMEAIAERALAHVVIMRDASDLNEGVEDTRGALETWGWLPEC